MGLAAKLEEALKKTDPFVSWVENLDTDDRTALERAAGNAALSTKKLANIIRDEGGKVGDDRLNKWRQSLGFSRG